MGMSVREIVKATMVERQMTYRAFAEALSEKTGMNMSHVTVLNWAQGQTVPQTDVMLKIKSAYPGDWRGEFAEKVLLEKFGDVFQTTS